MFEIAEPEPKYVCARKEIAEGSSATPEYRVGTVTGSKSTVSPNPKVIACVLLI
jgi:hypothetical protein